MFLFRKPLAILQFTHPRSTVSNTAKTNSAKMAVNVKLTIGSSTKPGWGALGGCKVDGTYIVQSAGQSQAAPQGQAGPTRVRW